MEIILNSLLIRAEDKNIWERRVPITPQDLKKIIKEIGIEAYIEKSKKRYFSEEDYVSAGAKVCESMTPGDVIFGIKEVLEEKILNNKVYFFFSHTIKGQKSGMPLLKKIIKSGSTLIDYEKIVDEKNKRLIYFGPYAGDAGTIDILSLMGEYWEHNGISNFFSLCKMAHQYDSVADAKNQIKKIGNEIKAKGLPKELTPMIIGVLGYGNVSIGVQRILDFLPTKHISPSNLEAFVKEGKYNSNTVYISIFKEKDLVKNKEGKEFDLQEYYNNPEMFESKFDQYLPYLNILINAVYWEKRYPKFVTWKSLKELYEKNPDCKLTGIADITCDVDGAIECTVKSTDSGMPAYLCDPITKTITDGHKGSGIVLLAVDNLPCELPNDSSIFFSNQLKTFIPNILKTNYEKTFENSGLCEEIKKAVIVYNGELTPSYKYLEKLL